MRNKHVLYLSKICLMIYFCETIVKLDEYGTTTNTCIFALKEFINIAAIKARARTRDRN